MKYFFRKKSLVESTIVEECLREKAQIDRVLAERAKLGPFLVESTERPVIDNHTEFTGSVFCSQKVQSFFDLIISESVRAIMSQIPYKPKNHLNDDIEKIVQENRCYELNEIDVMAIRLYTSAMAFVVNQALRNYSLYDMPIPTDFLPYIYALINGLVKIYKDRESNEVHSIKTVFYLFYFYSLRLVVFILDLSKWFAILKC